MFELSKKHWDLFWYNRLFHVGDNPNRIISNINTISFEEYNSQRQIQSKEILHSLFSYINLSNNEIRLLSENRFQTIHELKHIKRKRGGPYAIHPLSVEYLVSLLNVDSKTRIVAMNHDNLEELRTAKSSFSIDDLAKNYLGIKQRINSAFTNDEDKKLFTPKYCLDITLMMHKVTRLETDGDYYKSIDRLFEKNISYKTTGLEGAFYEFFKDQVKSKNINIDGHDYFELNTVDEFKPIIYDILSTNKEHLFLRKRDIHKIISSAALVKLADRISNTLDDYDKKKFSSYLKDTIKNLYLIDGLNEYISNKYANKMINSHDNKNLCYLRNVLIDVTKDMLNSKINGLVKNNKENRHFFYIKEYADEQRKEFRDVNGFKRIDKIISGGSSNLYEGNILTLWNRVMKGDKEYESKINFNVGEQYITLTSLHEIIKNYKNNNDYRLPGFELVKN